MVIRKSTLNSEISTIDMSPVGHSLVGASIALMVVPRDIQTTKKAFYLAAFIFFANLPDYSLLFWGLKGYGIGHSIFVLLALCLLIAFILRSLHSLIPQVSKWAIIISGILCCLSHLLLDSFYNHGHGVAIFWPFSTAHLILPLPWFDHWPIVPPFFTWEIIRISTIEFLFYAPLLLAVIVLRNLKQKELL